MRRHNRDLERTLTMVAHESGARLLGIEPTSSGHLKVIFLRGDNSVFLIAPSTPSDRRSMLNTQADARCMLRGLAR
jgi:hypothetical protein